MKLNIDPRMENTVLAGFNEFGFNESSRFNESILELKYFFAS